MTKELLDRYLKEAYRMGQVFWQQADSEFVSQHKKADVTKAKFDQLLIDAGEALAQQEQPAAVAYELEAVKFGNGKQLVYQKPKNLASYIKVRTLVYADADPAPTQPALSESQITSIAYNCNALPEVITDKTLVDFVRAIEAHCRGGQA